MRYILFLLLIIISSKSFASLIIKNESGESIYVAIGYYENSKWYSEGWWNLNHGESKIVYSGPLTNRYYYYRAFGKTSVWGGETTFIINSSSAFKYQQDAVTGNASVESKGFRKIDVGGQRDYTISLTSSSIAKKTSDDRILPSPIDKGERVFREPAVVKDRPTGDHK